MMAVYGVAPSSAMLALPLYLLGTIGSAAGAGILFAALIVTYRDVRYVMTFVMQLWLFGTPVLYTLDMHSGDVAARSTRSIRWSA